MLNGLSLLILGIYGGTVLYKGHVNELFGLLKDEGNFLVWISAVGIVGAIYQTESIHPIGKTLAGLTVAGLAMKIATNQNILALASSVAGGSLTINDAIKSLQKD